MLYHSISTGSGIANINVGQITRPCANDLAYNNTVTFDAPTDIADYIESVANIKSNNTAIEEALNSTNEGCLRK
jgi:hypothetical protein